jgi:amino-acid N-acetyltransferase
VQEIIQPLVEEGILVHRSDQHLLRELKHCFVMTRDDSVLACGTLKRYGAEHAEVGMLCVQLTQRRSGKGEILLAYLERRALLMGVKKVFLLSTRTMQWFEERGFVVASPSDLPPSREYDVSRKSKVYMKELGTHRDIDSEELLWNI